MKLITELSENIEYLSEAKESGEKEHYIHGIFLQANKKNRNGRIYPSHIMEKEVDRYMNDVVARRQNSIALLNNYTNHTLCFT